MTLMTKSLKSNVSPQISICIHVGIMQKHECMPPGVSTWRSRETFRMHVEQCLRYLFLFHARDKFYRVEPDMYRSRLLRVIALQSRIRDTYTLFYGNLSSQCKNLEFSLSTLALGRRLVIYFIKMKTYNNDFWDDVKDSKSPKAR